MASWIKPVLISTGFVAMAMHLKLIVPAVAVDFSRGPILLSSFLSWLKPPYLYVITNAIIVVIGVSSRYYRNIASNDGKDYEVLSYGGDYKFQTEHNVHRSPPRRSETKDEDFSYVVATPPSKITVEEKEIPEIVTERLAEAAAKVEEEKMCLTVVAKSENLTPVEKPLVSARIGQRKAVKTTAERNSLRALRVAKPKKQETLESTWKMITEGKPLTSYYRRPDTFGIGVGDSNKTKQSGGLKKSETLGDRTNYYLSPAVSRSRDELNRRAEAFINKCNNERFESMRQDKEVLARRGLSF
ncbi:unnamed protein product [Thlaspi arvense]|uniref:DUF4408 domain-containing protein n=1 Tax=Thlaspi arvense TaxID=13288 RepID=A0AAU9RCD5_THLAR|nr:unnamed protein product [Thlaspi arvense]